MPYIPKPKRPKLDFIAKNLVAELKEKGLAGNLNYFLFKLFVELQKENLIYNYQTMASFIAELECCKMELYIRPIYNYEVKKRSQNGDVE